MSRWPHNSKARAIAGAGMTWSRRPPARAGGRSKITQHSQVVPADGAGARSKAAPSVAHAGHGPTDIYSSETAGGMMAGEVRAPAISPDNAPLRRRHINSLVLEILRVDLPARWVPPLDVPQGDDGEPTRAIEHLCWDGCMFPNDVMEQPQTWNALLAAMMSVRSQHGWS